MSSIKLFESKQIRSVYNEEEESWYFSIVDVVGVLTDSPNPRNYWKVLKHRLAKEGSQLVTDCNQLKMQSADGKFYNTDVASTEQLLRLIQSIRNKGCQPFEGWQPLVKNNQSLKVNTSMAHLFTNALRLSFFVVLIFILAAFKNSGESEQSANAGVYAKNKSIKPIKIGKAVADTISPVCAAIDPIPNRAGVYNKYRWDSGQVVKVFFVNGSDSLKKVVTAYASEWMNHASVRFSFVKKLPADVTVKFIPGLDSWSLIGTNCKKANPSMNLGMDAMESELFIRSVVLHEFGHVLGLIHEHQSPDADIPWDVEAVYKHYAQIGWSRATTKANVLKRYSGSIVTNSRYDRQSIMQYSITEDLLTDPSFAIGWNFDLSETDRSFIRTYYNKRKPTPKPVHQPDDNRGIRGEAQKNHP